jgi:hypothetical protein
VSRDADLVVTGGALGSAAWQLAGRDVDVILPEQDEPGPGPLAPPTAGGSS